jgi:hypothetical protein
MNALGQNALVLGAGVAVMAVRIRQAAPLYPLMGATHIAAKRSDALIVRTWVIIITFEVLIAAASNGSMFAYAVLKYAFI